MWMWRPNYHISCELRPRVLYSIYSFLWKKTVDLLYSNVSRLILPAAARILLDCKINCSSAEDGAIAKLELVLVKEEFNSIRGTCKTKSLLCVPFIHNSIRHSITSIVVFFGFGWLVPVQVRAVGDIALAILTFIGAPLHPYTLDVF